MTVSFIEMVSMLDVSSVFLFLITVVVFSIPVFIIFPPLPVESSDALQQTHSKIGVSECDSNLRDQWTLPAAAATGEARPSQPTSPPRIQSLHIYPLKSCRGIELTEATVLPKGLEHDRVFCLAQLKTKKVSASSGNHAISAPDKASATTVDVDYWEVVTLRQVAHMAKISVDLWVPDPKKHSRQLGRMAGEGDLGSSCRGSSGESFLVVRFPWRDAGIKGLVQTVAAKISHGLFATAQREFILPLSYPSTHDIKAQGYMYSEVTLFRKVIPALNMATDIPDELAIYLGREPGKLALFRLDPNQRRQVFDCAPTQDAVGYQPEIDFQDAYPLHILNISSVRALESKIKKDADIDRLDVRRFRPNIIVSGLTEYDEDDWRTVLFKSTDKEAENGMFDVSCRTVRCKLPNVDPSTGIRHKAEPDYALRHYREIDAGAPKKGCMGMQMCPLFSSAGTPHRLQSTIRVGMEIVVLKRGTHHAM